MSDEVVIRILVYLILLENDLPKFPEGEMIMWDDIIAVLAYLNSILNAGDGLVVRRVISDEAEIGDGKGTSISLKYHDISNTQARPLSANVKNIQFYDFVELNPPWADLNDLYLALRLTEEWASPGVPTFYGTYFMKRRAFKLWDLFEVNVSSLYVTTYDSNTGLCSPLP